jgi:hypothetical protein
VAQNDATVKGSGNHDKTGHHCLPNDPNGKLSIAHHAGFLAPWRGRRAQQSVSSYLWDGCMFPNAVMAEPSTWNDILGAMIAVRDEHGWSEGETEPSQPAVGTRWKLWNLKLKPQTNRLLHRHQA